MTPRELRKLSRRRAVRARVISDGCRDYLVEIATDSGAGLLRSAGGARRFRNLGDVHALLKRCGISDVVLSHRVAHDEACARERASGFHDSRFKVAV